MSWLMQWKTSLISRQTTGEILDFLGNFERALAD